MKASFSELADFEPTEGGVFLWAQKLLAEQREQGIQVLKSLIQHPNLWVKSTALAIAGSRFVPEVENEIRTCLGDRRTPPSPVGEFGLPGRISTRAIRSCAVAALDKLGLQIDT